MSPPRRWRARASLNAAVEGWLAGLGALSVIGLPVALLSRRLPVWLEWLPAPGADFLSILGCVGFLFLTLFLVLAAWLILALPFVLVMPHQGWLFRRWGARLSGFVLGALTAGSLFCLALPDPSEASPFWPLFLLLGLLGSVGFDRYVKRVAARAPLSETKPGAAGAIRR